MACDITTFKARFPEIDPSIVDAKFQFAIDEIGCYYEQSCLGDSCSDTALCMGVAHLIIIDAKISPSTIKDKASVSVDGVSVSSVLALNANASEIERFWNTSKYGQRFLQLTSSCGYGAFFL